MTKATVHGLVHRKILGVLPLKELEAILGVRRTTEVAEGRRLLVLGLTQLQGLGHGTWPAVELHLQHIGLVIHVLRSLLQSRPLMPQGRDCPQLPR